MSASLTGGLVVTATAFGGALAGLSLDRSLVQLPAWHRVGPVSWAAFSREADLGNGRVVYPVVGVGSAMLSIAAAAAILLDHPVRRTVAVPAAAAAVLAVGHTFATAQAAPNMLSVGRLGDDEPALRGALDRFTRWQAIRPALQVVAFMANLWSLVASAKT
jgi:hypothetical protein